MKYFKRYAEQKLKRLAENFSAVLVNGSRQVGKSTLLKHVFPEAREILFDPYFDEYRVKEDPDLFLNNFPPPLILDEVQYVPELLSAIKRRLEKDKSPGMYLMSGSQNLMVLKTVSESMAGRVAILNLEAMSIGELYGSDNTTGWLNKYIEDPFSLLLLKSNEHAGGSMVRNMWRGGLPGIIEKPDDLVPDYMKAYVETYLERDIRVMGNVQDLADFRRFLELSAALTSQEINNSEFGRELGYSGKTAGKWLGLLQNTYLWRENQPYHGNTIKRISKKPKGYFSDTGLICYLLRISSPESLISSTMLGSIFETWVLNEITRQIINLPLSPRIYHWRTNGGAEVDIILEIDGKFYPIEAKSTTRLGKNDIRGIKAFRDTYSTAHIMPGLVVYAGDKLFRIDDNTIAIPWNCIF